MDPMRRYGIFGLDAASGSTEFDDPNFVPEPDPIADRKCKLEFAHTASVPRKLFEKQVSEEMHRLLEQNPDFYVSMARKPALEAVKEAWIEQGIWRPNWYAFRMGVGARWKHQDPLENEGELRGTHPDPIVVTNPAPREPENDEDRRRMERDRDASRPLPQFLYQVKKACDRLVAKHQANAPPAAPEPPDLGTAAYDEVRELWTKWGIWNNRWGVMPGRTWLHEHPFEDLLRDELPEALPLHEKEVAEIAAAIAYRAANPRPSPPHLGLFGEAPAHATHGVPPKLHTSQRNRRVELNPQKSVMPEVPSLFGGDLEPVRQPQSLPPVASGIPPPAPIPSLFGGDLERQETRCQPQSVLHANSGIPLEAHSSQQNRQGRANPQESAKPSDATKPPRRSRRIAEAKSRTMISSGSGAKGRREAAAGKVETTTLAKSKGVSKRPRAGKR